MKKMNMKEAIYESIKLILIRDKKNYAELKEIYEEVSKLLNVDNSKNLQSQIRGRLQENCHQYSSFMGQSLFFTEKIRSGRWTIKMDKNKYLRYINNTYLITNDGWESITKINELPSNYKLEEDSKLAYFARLSFEIGDEQAELIINELKIIERLLKEIKNFDCLDDGYGNAFEVFAVATLHNLTYEKVIKKYLINGSEDGQIDAIVFEDENVASIYQVKIKDIQDNVYQIMQKNYDLCLNRKECPTNAKCLYEFINTNRSELEKRKVKLISVSCNSLNKNNIKPSEIYELYFQNRLLPLENNNLTLRIPKPKLLDAQYNVSTDGNNNFIFFIKASELINCLLESLGLRKYDKLGEKIDLSKFFYDNVRGELEPNYKMLNTINKEPENFIKYNNGINITGEVEDLGIAIKINNPMINNGQQTITTLIKKLKNLDSITLSVKITNEVKREIKSKISRYSNEQAKVSPIDILSLNPFIRDVQKKIIQNKYKGEKYFLKIYSSGKKEYDDMLERLYKTDNIISLSDFIKLYYSVDNGKNLGTWKNCPNNQLEDMVIDKEIDIDIAFRVCETIVKFKNFLKDIKIKKDKEDYQSADLAFKYLLCKEQLSVSDAEEIIKNINKKHYYNRQNEKSKLIDIYKSTRIIYIVEEELREFRKKNKNMKSLV